MSKAGVGYSYAAQDSSCPDGNLTKAHAATGAGTNAYCYDLNGNMVRRTIAGVSYTLEYDAENRLTAVRQGTTTIASFTYDGDGKRVKGTVNGATTTYIGDYAEWMGSTSTLVRYFYADGVRVAMKAGSTVYYLIGDHLGSTSVVATSSGGLQGRQLYKAWGEPRYASASLPTAYTYTGQYSHMTDFGLYFYGARWLDPVLGRFAQADTVIPLESQGVQAWDRFAYTNNNPIKYNDPTGHDVGCGGRDASECNSTSSKPKSIQTNSILLDGGPGSISYGTAAEESFTNFSTSGEQPSTAWVNAPDFINFVLVWLRDNTDIRLWLGNVPEVSGKVYYELQPDGWIITGVSITNNSYEAIEVIRVSTKNYSIYTDEMISSDTLYPYAYSSIRTLNYGVALPSSTSNMVLLTSNKIPTWNYANVEIRLLSQSGRHGYLTSIIEINHAGR